LIMENPINLTILAYGQTGSGKTFTISGNSSSRLDGHTLSNNSLTSNFKSFGLIQMILNLLIKNEKINISFIEVYNEKIYDGIDSKEKAIREDKDKFYIQDLEKKSVDSMREFEKLWQNFSNNRKIGETDLNLKSSRSHTIIRIETNKIVINLVDLAGSEDNKRTGNTGERMEESKNINTSLFVLNKVVNSIIKNDLRIPYRDSKLTRVLKESLNGVGKCFIIATVIDEIDEAGLTANTLSFASKSRQIKTIEKPNTPQMITSVKKIEKATSLRDKINLPQEQMSQPKDKSIVVKGLVFRNFNELNNCKQPIKQTDSIQFSNITVESPGNEIKNSPKLTEQIRKLENSERVKRSNAADRSNSSSSIKCPQISNQIEMTPITKQKSKECFVNKALEYEKVENYKMALDIYKTVNKISPSDEFEQKIAELQKKRKITTNSLMSLKEALFVLNSGDLVSLKKLNGVGEKRAEIIADFIAGGNSFECLDDLKILFSSKVVNLITSGILMV
jgi:kinesin family protein 22